MTTLSEFFLNSGTSNEEKAVVEAPAFSLTKVMAVVAPLVTALVTWASSQLESVSFTSGQITAIICALVGFLAVTAAADVIARGVSTSADKAATGRGKWIRFEPPLKGRLTGPDKDEDVTIVAASDAQPSEYLCARVDKPWSWEHTAKVTIVS